jgi:hypothetical protein
LTVFVTSLTSARPENKNALESKKCGKEDVLLRMARQEKEIGSSSTVSLSQNKVDRKVISRFPLDGYYSFLP